MQGPLQPIPDVLHVLSRSSHKNGHATPAPPSQTQPQPQPQSQPQPSTSTSTFTASDLMEVTFPPPKWAIEGILPEGFSILAGRPKLGKSWMGLGWAVAVATGGVALGSVPVEQGDVLYLALEDTPRRLQSRLRTMLSAESGAAPQLDRLTLATAWKRVDKGGLSLIDGWMAEHRQARLVVIDTLQKVKPRQRSNGSLYDEDYAATEGLKALADKHGVAMVALHHVRKMGADDPLEMVSGTFGLTGSVDTVLVLQRERGRHDATLYMRGRDVDEQELALRWDADIASWSLLGDAAEYRQTETQQAILRLLKEASEPLSPKELVERLGDGVDYATTKTQLWRMAQDGTLTSDKGRYSIKAL